jgi:hypothetical protein
LFARLVHMERATADFRVRLALTPLIMRVMDHRAKFIGVVHA